MLFDANGEGFNQGGMCFLKEREKKKVFEMSSRKKKFCMSKDCVMCAYAWTFPGYESDLQAVPSNNCQLCTEVMIV